MGISIGQVHNKVVNVYGNYKVTYGVMKTKHGFIILKKCELALKKAKAELNPTISSRFFEEHQILLEVERFKYCLFWALIYL